jgi:hypothetical protein
MRPPRTRVAHNIHTAKAARHPPHGPTLHNTLIAIRQHEVLRGVQHGPQRHARCGGVDVAANNLHYLITMPDESEDGYSAHDCERDITEE